MHRAMSYLSEYVPGDNVDLRYLTHDMLNANLEESHAGAPFPDYCYECCDHDAGEYAHWPPFLAVGTNFLREQGGNDPKNWNATLQGLASFLMGVTSHQIADVNWHGLSSAPSGYGAIETLGGMDYNCTGRLAGGMRCLGGQVDGGIAHTMADTGGEFLASYQTDLGWYEPEDWVIPVDLLVELFHRANFTEAQVNASDIEECAVIFVTGGLATQYAAWALAHSETQRAPSFYSSFLDLDFGGIDDMAVWTKRMQHRFGTWLLNGVPSDIPPDMDQPPSGARLESSRAFRSLGRAVLAEVRSSEMNREYFPTAQRLSDGTLHLSPPKNKPSLPIILSLVKNILSNHKSTLHPSIVSLLSRCLELTALKPSLESPPTRDPQATTRAQTALGYVGASMASFQNGGKEYVVLGSPGYSGVNGSCPLGGGLYVVDSENLDTTLPAAPTVSCSAGVYGKIGASLAIMDFDGDGSQNVVSSASTAFAAPWDTVSRVPEFEYKGAIVVYEASSSLGLVRVIAAERNLTFFGSVLGSFDVNGDSKPDLLVGCPLAYVDAGATIPGRNLNTSSTDGDPMAAERGAVFVFYSGSQAKRALDADKILNVPSTSSSALPYEKFGSSFLTISINHQSYLLIGAPGSRTNSLHAGFLPTGKIYAYSLPLTSTTPSFTISGSDPIAQLGSSMALVGSSYLALGLPHANSTAPSPTDGFPTPDDILVAPDAGGRVAILPLSPSLLSNASISTLLQNGTLLCSGIPYSRFGASLIYRPHQNELIIGAPTYSDIPSNLTANPDIGGGDTGAIYAFTLSTLTNSPVLPDATSHASWTSSAASVYSRFGHQMHTLQNGTLLVGAPRANEIQDTTTNRLQGWKMITEMPGATFLFR